MKEILKQGWNLQIKESKSIQSNVWEIETKHQRCILKKSNLKPEHLRYICTAEILLAENGFPLSAPLLKTVHNDLFFYHPRGNYTLHKVLPGEKGNFNDTDHLLYAAATVGTFHNCNFGMFSTNQNRDRIPDRLLSLAQKTQELKTMAAMAETNPDAFGKQFLKGFTQCYKRATATLEQLENSSYSELCRISLHAGHFIHGDIAARNFIIADCSAYLIDFDYCRCDIPVMDLVRLLRRSLKSCDDEALINTVFRGYCSKRPLLQAEFEVLKILLLFPQKFWRTAHRYYFETDKYPQIGAEKKLEAAIAESDRTQALTEKLEKRTEDFHFES